MTADDRYHKAAHAMQSGVASDPDKSNQEPKHLRVGINCRAVDHAGLVTLLMEKGVFTKEEYLEALAVAMEAEHKRYEEYLERHFGMPVTLA